MIYWLLGGIAVFVIAFIIIKLLVNTNQNEDSKLGILKHPSFFEKQGVEMVEDYSTKDSGEIDKE